MRWLFLLLVCFVGIGLYRGWFSFTSPNRDAETSKLNVNVSVDTQKLESDILAAKQRVDAVIVGQSKTTENPADKATESTATMPAMTR